MKVIIAAAGTGGHINPALAIANKIKQEEPNSKIVFIGTDRGLENDLVPRAGYELKTIDAYGFNRKISIDNIKKIYKTFKSIKQVKKIIEEVKPDIVIITGHDAYYRKKGDKTDINNYKNSKNFVLSVKQARKYEKSHEKLIIIAGACQSNYEELIKAGANFASSPKRVNIHALDPAIIAVNIALTEKSKRVDLINLLDKTKNGPSGIGGIMCNGMMYVGYPR